MQLSSVLMRLSVSAPCGCGLLGSPHRRFYHLCPHDRPFGAFVDTQRAISPPAFYRRCVHDIPIPIDEPTLRDHSGFLYYGYVAASWEPPLADHTVSVMWNLNLANIIVLLARHFLSTMCFIILMPLCFAPPLGVTGKRVKHVGS